MKNALKDNEILIFTDFNNTFVDFHAEYDNQIQFYEDFDEYLANIKSQMNRCLIEFEKQTGLKPVVCLVTNASMFYVDNNGYMGVCHDIMMTFFRHGQATQEQIKHNVEHSCEKYIKYVMHRENDGYLEINPYGQLMEDMFIPHLFSDEAMKIKHTSIKRESVERFVHDFGPVKGDFVIFAGDSIIDDYPMKYAVTGQGINKIFIRPGKVKHMKPSIMQQFCLAKGVQFECVNPKNNKKIKVIDESNIRFLSEEDRRKLEDFADGDIILLTSQNSRGFIEGIYQSIDIINSYKSRDIEKIKDI